MNQNKNEKISEYLRTIASKENITELEVRNEIAYAVSLALKSSDPNVQNLWKKIPCKGASPTIEEIIDFIATGIATRH